MTNSTDNNTNPTNNNSTNNTQGGIMPNLDEQPATLTNTNTGETIYGTAGELGPRFYRDNMSADGWTYAVQSSDDETQDDETDDTQEWIQRRTLAGIARLFHSRPTGFYRDGDGSQIAADLTAEFNPADIDRVLVTSELFWDEMVARGAATESHGRKWSAGPVVAPSIIQTVALEGAEEPTEEPTEPVEAVEATTARRYTEDQQEALTEAGFETVSTFHSHGSTMVESLGEDNARRFWTQRRTKHERQPLIEEALERVAAIVAAENRWQRLVPVKDLNFDGRWLVLPCGEKVAIEAGALRSWSDFSSGKAHPSNGEKVKLSPRESYIAHSTASEIGAMFDSRKDYPEWQVTRKGITRPQQIQLLGRDIPGVGRTVYAVASSTYNYGGADSYLRALAAELSGQGFRGEVKYNSENTRVTGSCFKLDDEETAIHRREGDAFAYGFAFKTGDNGGSGYGINPVVKRDRCNNHSMVATSMLKLKQRRHSGRQSPTQKARNVVQDAVATLWNTAWNRLGEIPAQAAFTIDDDATETPMQQIIAELTTKGANNLLAGIGSVPGMNSEQRRDMIVEALLLSAEQTQKEGLSRVMYQPTLQDVVNVVTRCHDKVPVFVESQTDSIQTHIEKTAGEWVSNWSALEQDSTTLEWSRA